MNRPILFLVWEYFGFFIVLLLVMFGGISWNTFRKKQRLNIVTCSSLLGYNYCGNSKTNHTISITVRQYDGVFSELRFVKIWWNSSISFRSNRGYTLKNSQLSSSIIIAVTEKRTIRIPSLFENIMTSSMYCS